MSRIRGAEAEGKAWPREFRNELDTVLGSLALLDPFAEGDITCLIAPNDRQGLHLHAAWVQRAGLRIPRDVSLISFDDDQRGAIKSVTTVNPGFDTAAYQAVHFILGDTPFPGLRNGQMPCTATVVDHGTVGTPPDRPVKW
jgi:DNA-binding LacI/PurR family transcriptional regulator